ncbi:MAG: isoleucine--tRNA ligase [Candidatus Aenigmarchaeota archaeon]|nr:isoleucine--tRNA ligase [Candidatus Aenigmarchaeota archaeon]
MENERYEPQKLEKEVLEFWEKNKIFNKLVEKNSGKKPWFFMDGPITANNPMGVHHAWGRTLKDIYQRFKAMQGFDQRFQNGFDCQGLWLEVEVEKELGLNSKKDIEKFGLENFSRKCRERVEKFSKIQTQQSIRLGQWMDWENSYYTFSDNNIKHIWHFLKKCHENGWLYKGKRSLPWCWRCGTASSKHEMSDGGYAERQHVSVYFQSPIKGRKNEYLLIWTTTPWTLTSNVLAAVSAEFKYVKVEHDGKVYYLGEKACKRLIPEAKILAELKGKELAGLEYTGPFDYLPAQKGVVHKVVLWEEVGEEEGTGIVHIAPGCGEADYVLGKKLGAKAIAPLTEDGKYIEGFDWLTGKHVTEVLGPILSDLQKNGFFFKKEKVTHRYPICWRCKEDLVFRLDDAWYIKADGIREKMKANNQKINWYPEHVQKLMEDWLTNMEDWNISRKRYWGLPLMFYECECGNLEVVGSLEELKKKAVNPGVVDKLPELHRPWIDEVKIKCQCGKEVKRITDVGDCWLDAGIVPFSTLNYLEDKKYWKKWYPASQVIEMRAQVRLWFYSLLFMSTTLEGDFSYKNVLAYEEVRDESGKPMHKSSGNAIWFDDAVEKMGADVMRWVYTGQNPSFNLKFGFNIASEEKKKLDILFNLVNYIKTYLEDNNFKKSKLKPQDILTKWFLSRLETLKKSVKEDLDSMQSHKAIKELEDFVLNEFSRFYVHLIRDKVKRGYDGKDKDEVLQVLYAGMLDSMKLLAPFTPFLAEHVYQNFFRQFEKTESIHLLDWPESDDSLVNKSLEADMDRVKLIVEAINFMRQETGIKARWPLSEISVQLKEGAESMKDLADAIKTLGNAESVNFVKDVKGGKEFEWGKLKLGSVLKDDALIRELIRKTQELRKTGKLQVSDSIEALFISDKETLGILKKFEMELVAGVGAKKVAFSEKNIESKGELDFDGKKVKIDFQRVQ